MRGKELEVVKLSNGIEMSVLRFGVNQATDPDESRRDVSEALRAGCCLIDTAAAYGGEDALNRKKSETAAADSALQPQNKE